MAVCLVVGVLAAAGAYLATRDGDSEGESSAAGTSLEGTGASAGSVGGVSGGSASAGEAETEAETIPPEPEGLSESSELVAGRYVQSGTFRTYEGAEEEVARLRGRGIDVFAIPSAWANELLPGFQVLLVGPVVGAGEEARVERALTRARVSGFGRDLTASTAQSGASSLAGSWSGEVEESSLGGSSERTRYGAEVTIAAGGETGTINYPEQDCGGTLTLLEDKDFSIAYAETIEYGSCIDAGVWHLRLTDEGLDAVWLHDNHDLMVEGTLSALG